MLMLLLFILFIFIFIFAVDRHVGGIYPSGCPPKINSI
jgi:hypothetical protein